MICQICYRLMGKQKALEMFTLDISMSAAEAERCGLVTRVYSKDQFQIETEKRINNIASQPFKVKMHYNCQNNSKIFLAHTYITRTIGKRSAFKISINTNTVDSYSKFLVSLCVLPDAACVDWAAEALPLF